MMRPGDALRCSICERPIDAGLPLLGGEICSLCERISATIAVDHPLYTFWVQLIRTLWTREVG